jgi:DNA-binding sugar fermentation-stimulating protein
VFRPQKDLKKTRIKLYNTLAFPGLLYGSETWTIKSRDARKITAAEIKYTRKTAGYIWIDYKTNIQIAKELKNSNFRQITRIQEKLDTCKQNAS